MLSMGAEGQRPPHGPTVSAQSFAMGRESGPSRMDCSVGQRRSPTPRLSTQPEPTLSHPVGWAPGVSPPPGRTHISLEVLTCG